MTDAAHPVAIETLLTHRAWVRGLAWSLVRDTHLVDEVEQETWLRALRSPPREEAAARGWLGTVVRNVVRNRFRSESRREHYEGTAVPRTASPGAGDVVARADAQQQLVRIVMGLDEPARSTLLLRFYDGLPPREVSARMGVPVETVRTRTRRALQKVRAQLEEERGGRRAAFALLAPLLAEAPPPPGGESGATVGGAAAGSASVAATTTGALIMAAATKKTAVLAAAVLLLGAGAAALVVSESSGAAPDASATVAVAGSDAAAATAARDRQRVRPGESTAATGLPVPATPDAPLTDITVRRADGSFAGGASIVVDARGDEPHVVRAGPDGVAEVARSDQDRWVLAAADGAVPTAALVPAGAEGVTIDLQAGAAVSGIVRVDGRAPDAPMRLQLNVDNALAAQASISSPAWESLEDLGFSAWNVPVTTDADGRFRVEGLPAGERAWIAPPDGYRMEATGGENLLMRTPASEVVLAIYRMPRVRGRVVQPDGAPVSRAHLTLHWDDGFGSGSMRRSADDEGRFDFPLPVRGLGSITLRPSDPATDAGITLDVPPAGADLGDLVLPGNREVLVSVVDSSGSPVADAVLRGAAGAAVRSAADGTARLLLPNAAAEVTVAAPVFRPLVHEIPVGAAEPHRITLRPGTRAAFVVAGADAALRRRLTVILSHEGERLFEAGLPAGHLLAADAIGTGSGSESDFGDGRFVTRAAFSVADAQGGPVRVDGIRAETPFSVQLVDDHGYVHAAREVRLPLAEITTVALPVEGPGRPFTGTVLGPAGKPIAGARVRFAADGDRAAETFQPSVVSTDAEGRFTIPVVHADELKLLVTADGHVPQGRRSSRTGGTFRLVEGRSILITIRDAEGSLVEPYSVAADLETAWGGGTFLWQADEEPGGAYRLDGLPGSDSVDLIVTIETERGEAHHRFPVDPNTAMHELVLGEPESLDTSESAGD